MSTDPATYARLREIASRLPAVPGISKVEIANGMITMTMMVFAEAALESAAPALLPHEVVLVVEVVSTSNPENDYENKVHDYAAMGIPHYLLVDPRDGTGIVHSQPGYASREKFAFGDTVPVGPWTIDTSGLLTYA
ncbi:isoleucyl-tRNA synthetase [Kitasatospora gansuensis]|uniref:Isoleucyl-tRNA synthetase n=1 Tax=Kitasatospora gansuensis TaxID=258050 RepID=A0A7W7WII9_9ACTN|nr:Uma2 family endonuclease [Kitasatospora gansuensis]MBB4948837.1 isoleucyl-tRNA synthetase [Kitasatospora gansuensis]